MRLSVRTVELTSMRIGAHTGPRLGPRIPLQSHGLRVQPHPFRGTLSIKPRMTIDPNSRPSYPFPFLCITTS